MAATGLYGTAPMGRCYNSGRIRTIAVMRSVSGVS